MKTPEQATINTTRLLLGCYFVALVIVLVACGAAAAYLWPAWTPMEVFSR